MITGPQDPRNGGEINPRGLLYQKLKNLWHVRLERGKGRDFCVMKDGLQKGRVLCTRRRIQINSNRMILARWSLCIFFLVVCERIESIRVSERVCVFCIWCVDGKVFCFCVCIFNFFLELVAQCGQLKRSFFNQKIAWIACWQWHFQRKFHTFHFCVVPRTIFENVTVQSIFLLAKTKLHVGPCTWFCCPPLTRKKF